MHSQQELSETKTVFRYNHNLIKRKLSEYQEPIIQNVNLTQYESDKIFILDSISKIIAIVHQNSTSRQQQIKNKSYPWIECNKYRKLLLKRDRYKTIQKRNPNQFHTTELKNLNQQLRVLFDDLKSKYYSDMITECTGQPKKLYKMLEKRKKLTEIPTSMFFEKTKVEGSDRFTAILNQLKSNFGSPIFPINDNERGKMELDGIYEEYFVTDDELWNGYVNHFSRTGVLDALDDLGLDVDPGPMSIPAEVFVNNKQVMSEILTGIFNKILSTG